MATHPSVAWEAVLGSSRSVTDCRKAARSSAASAETCRPADCDEAWCEARLSTTWPTYGALRVIPSSVADTLPDRIDTSEKLHHLGKKTRSIKLTSIQLHHTIGSYPHNGPPL